MAAIHSEGMVRPPNYALLCEKWGSLGAESIVPAGVNPTPDHLDANFGRKWVIFVTKMAV